MTYTADTVEHCPADSLPLWARLGLFLGPALLLIATALVRRRIAGSWSVRRLTVATVLVALAALGGRSVRWRSPACSSP
jgi:hypothetical protein